MHEWWINPKVIWLWFHALNTIINLIVALGFELDPFVDGGETFYQFDVELQFLKKNVQ